MSPRRFPPPWSVEEQKACFMVRDRNGQQLAYVYFEGQGPLGDFCLIAPPTRITGVGRAIFFDAHLVLK